MAHLAAQHVLKTHGLEILEMKKLKLEPYVLDTTLQIDSNIAIHINPSSAGVSLADIEDRLEFADQTFGDDANMLQLKGLYILSHEKSEKAYQRAYKLFEQAIKTAPDNEEALYFLGLMNLLGLGRDQDISAALDYFDRPELKNNPKAMNAKGFIFLHAPDMMEQDPVKLKIFGPVRQDLKAAYANFKKAANKDYANAKFNLGTMHLSGLSFNLPKGEADAKLEFSFSKAYKHFMEAAEKGHTLAAYNLAVMH